MSAPKPRRAGNRYRPTIRAFLLLLAGLACGLWAYWDHQRALLVPAVLLIGIVVAGVVLAVTGAKDRRIEIEAPDIVTEGQEAVVTAVFGSHIVGRWRAALDGFSYGWTAIDARRADFVVSGLSRGLWGIGPFELSTKDAFGILEVRRRLGETVVLFVGPRVSNVSLRGLAGLGGEDARSIGRGDQLDQLVREYRPGDPMRRVHWKQTAKHGAVMVRQDQPDERRSVRIVLDARAAPGAELHARARAFASYATALRRAGYLLDVVEFGDPQIALAAEPGLVEIRRAGAAIEGIAADTAPPQIASVRRGQEIVILGDQPADALISELPPGSLVVHTDRWQDERPSVPRGVAVVDWHDDGWSIFA